MPAWQACFRRPRTAACAAFAIASCRAPLQSPRQCVPGGSNWEKSTKYGGTGGFNGEKSTKYGGTGGSNCPPRAPGPAQECPRAPCAPPVPMRHAHAASSASVGAMAPQGPQKAIAIAEGASEGAPEGASEGAEQLQTRRSSHRAQSDAIWRNWMRSGTIGCDLARSGAFGCTRLFAECMLGRRQRLSQRVHFRGRRAEPHLTQPHRIGYQIVSDRICRVSYHVGSHLPIA